MAKKPSMGLKASRAIGNTLGHILLVIISVVWILPFIFIVLQSFRVENTAQVSYIIPQKWGFDNYIYLFSAECNFIQWYFNTFIVALIVAVLQTVMVLMIRCTGTETVSRRIPIRPAGFISMNPRSAFRPES